jgi:nucleotide-binding universal stress UspA family protein
MKPSAGGRFSSQNRNNRLLLAKPRAARHGPPVYGITMKAIIAAIDFSKVSNLVVTQAEALARAVGGKVVLVTVLVEPIYLTDFALPQKGIAKIAVAHERAVRKRLEAMQKKLESDFVPAETIVRRGNAARHILEEAEEHDAALIVIGSHGHTAFFELLLGSTTQAVLKSARQPVVVIPPKMRKPRRIKTRVVALPAGNDPAPEMLFANVS